MKLLFLMDPVATIVPGEDTSFALMRSAIKRGHRVDHAEFGHLQWREGDLWARAARVSLNGHPCALATRTWYKLEGYDVIFIRKDPPFDPQYLWVTLLLEHLRDRVFMLNDPRGLRDANEKFYACWFAEWIPETCVSSDRRVIEDFVSDVGGTAVIKPIDGHGGSGIFALRHGDNNFNSIVETVTHTGTRLAMIQRYLPEVTEGDKRILLLEGEVLGAILRRPKNDLRSNMHVGGSAEPTEVSPHEHSLVEALKPWLRRDGLYFVGIDVIGGKLTEVNVTSPTGIEQMSRFANQDLSDTVLAWLERRLASAAA